MKGLGGLGPGAFPAGLSSQGAKIGSLLIKPIFALARADGPHAADRSDQGNDDDRRPERGAYTLETAVIIIAHYEERSLNS